MFWPLQTTSGGTWYICMYVYVCVFMYICMNVYVHMYIYVYMYVYVYIYIYLQLRVSAVSEHLLVKLGQTYSEIFRDK
jgi:hypothetical protein